LDPGFFVSPIEENGEMIRFRLSRFVWNALSGVGARVGLRRLGQAPGRRARVRCGRPESLEPRVLLDANLVKDINASGGASINNLVEVNGTLYFTADDGTHGTELWKSDGTSAGTVMVMDIDPSFSNSSNPNWLTNVNGTLYFTAHVQGETSRELWKSDGTEGGTMLVKDIGSSIDSGNPHDLTNVNGTLFFAAEQTDAFGNSIGDELWKSDGTPGGTTLVRDIYPGLFNGSNPQKLRNVNGTLYFTAFENSHGRELWKSNGTSGGTVMVRDITPGPGAAYGSYPDNLTNVNGTLYFSAKQDDIGGGTIGFELWKSDGTEGGTVLVKNINPTSYAGSNPSNLTNVNGTLFFSADDGTNGNELWMSDGTAGGTVLVKNINNGSNPGWLTNVNGTLFFTANEQGVTSRELWKSDGTEGGTMLVRDIGSSIDSGNPHHLTNVNGKLYFAAEKTDAFGNSIGDEPWKSDGTSAGTVLVQDINPGFATGSSPSNLTNVNGAVFFSADDGTNGNELWMIPPENLAPTNITLSATSVPENQSSGTTVGTFTTIDPDAGNTFTYTLVSGTGSTDNGSFSITGGVLKTAAQFNFESKSSYSIRVRSTDQGTLWVEKSFTITVTNVNETPTDITLSATSVPENQSIGTTVGTFTTIDPDAGDTFSYTLVSGTGSTDNGSFSIAGGGLQTAASFNFESKSSYSIRVRSTDSGTLWVEKSFTITVTNVNETPTDITLSATSVAENQASGTTVGSFTTIDPDAGNTFTYTLVSGTGSTDNGSFSIAGGVLQTAASFNFESKSSYSIRVRSADQGGLSVEKQFVITITNVNETPTNLALSPTSIAENQSSGTAVGTFTTTDPDTGNTFTYTLVSGTGSTDNASFTIDGNTLKSAGSFDFETKSSYSIRVRTTDQGGLWYETQFTINVSDGNDGATQVVLSNVVTSLLATANTSSAIPLADVSVTDDGMGTNTLSLSGPDAATFELVSGQLRLKAGTVLNYATKKIYSVTVNVDDTTVGGTPDASVDYTLSLQGFDGLTIQNGSVGRSYVRYVNLNFGTSLGLSSILSTVGTATPRLSLTFAGTTGTQAINKSLTSLVTVVGNQLKIDFGVNGVGGDRNSLLGDGVYRLRVDLDGDGTLETTSRFHRLFGDVDGNGVVNAADIGLVQAAQGQTGGNLATDLNGDGLVNLTDLNNVKRRNGAKVILP
jgi:ELWxxDGT repeat protein